ncbi:MAG TPA: hypothetical protein VG815_17870, partial [Chloroflexota bacterium]|nr:hypothetical protein [Chloroflexota bacterium]
GGNRVLMRVLRASGRGRSPQAVVGGCRRRLGGRDPFVIFVTRLIPVFRLYASIATGLIQVKFRHFLVGAAPAAWIWASIPLTAGYLLGPRLGAVVGQYPAVTRYVVVGSIAVTLIVAAAMWRSARSQRHSARPTHSS